MNLNRGRYSFGFSGGSGLVLACEGQLDASCEKGNQNHRPWVQFQLSVAGCEPRSLCPTWWLFLLCLASFHPVLIYQDEGPSRKQNPKVKGSMVFHS